MGPIPEPASEKVAYLPKIFILCFGGATTAIEAFKDTNSPVLEKNISVNEGITTHTIGNIATVVKAIPITDKDPIITT